MSLCARTRGEKKRWGIMAAVHVCVCVCVERGKREGTQGSLTKWLVASAKPKSCVSEIQNWASHVFNGPESERERERKQKTNQNPTYRYRHRRRGRIRLWNAAEFKQASFAPWWLFPFFSHCRAALTTTTQSGERERVLTNVKDGGVKCIVLRRRRQVRERERERERWK